MTLRNRLARPAVEALMLTSLRRQFSEVLWVGDAPPRLPEVPVVLYANHHMFWDGYLAWLLAVRTLGRDSRVWMRELHRFPLFTACGARPFPPDDATRRVATMRETVRHLHRDTSSLLVLFPSGKMHPPEEGVAPFAAPMERLARLLPEPTLWWPVALHTSWREAARPVALMQGGTPHGTPDGGEHQRLVRLVDRLRSGMPDATVPLLPHGLLSFR